MTTTTDQTTPTPDTTPPWRHPPGARPIARRGPDEELRRDADGFVEMLRDLDVLVTSTTLWLDNLPRGGDPRERHAAECVTRLVVRVGQDVDTLVQAGESLARDVADFVGEHAACVTPLLPYEAREAFVTARVSARSAQSYADEARALADSLPSGATVAERETMARLRALIVRVAADVGQTANVLDDCLTKFGADGRATRADASTDDRAG
jgi:hypothetical protein